MYNEKLKFSKEIKKIIDKEFFHTFSFVLVGKIE